MYRSNGKITEKLISLQQFHCIKYLIAVVYKRDGYIQVILLLILLSYFNVYDFDI